MHGFLRNSVLFAFVLLSGCTVHRFPVRPPVVEQSRNVYARAKAQEHFIRARDFERRGLAKMAEREYEKALQLDPQSKLLEWQLIRSYIESGRYTQALLIIKKGRKNSELNREEKRTVSTIYLKMGEIAQAAWILETVEDKKSEELYSLGLIYESLGNPEKAIYWYMRCFVKNPETVQVGFKVGRMLLAEKRFDEAESLMVAMQDRFREKADIYSLRASIAVSRGDTTTGFSLWDSALVADSVHEESLRNRAQILIGRSEFAEAIVCYRKLVENSEAAELYGRTLAMLYQHNSQYDEAEALLKRMLESAMDDFDLHYMLALVFTASNRTDLARIEFEKAVTLQPDFRDAWHEFCSMYIRNKNFNEALSVAQRFVAVLPNTAIAWRMKGHVESLLEKYPAAVTSLRKSVALDSSDAYTWFELGSAFERNSERERAVKAFKKVLALRPQDAATLNYIGYMWAEEAKNLDSARIYLQEALRQEPHNGAFLDSYAWILYQSGDYDSAYVYLMLATERIYDDPVLYHHLGDILTKRNDLAGADAAYRRSLELNTDEAEKVREKLIELDIMIRREKQQSQ